MDTDIVFDTVATFCQQNNSGQELTLEERNYIVKISDTIAAAEDLVFRDGTSIALRCDYMLESRDYFDVLLQRATNLKYNVKDADLQALAKMNNQQRDEMLNLLMESKRIPVAERSLFRANTLFRIASWMTLYYLHSYGYVGFWGAIIGAYVNKVFANFISQYD